MDEKVKTELKKLVEGDLYDLYVLEMDTKENIKVVCKSAEETVGVKASDIKKLVVTLYKASMDEDAAKFEEFRILYDEVIG
jgi:hypothetical protein